MSERYFVSYFGNFGEGVGVHSTVVVTKDRLETAEHIRGLTEYLTEEAGYPVVILSLYHMCTVEEQEEEGLEDTAWVDEALGNCDLTEPPLDEEKKIPLDPDKTDITNKEEE